MCCDTKSTQNHSVCSPEMEAIHSHSHAASSCSGSCVPDVHTVSPADFHIILRNLSVGVGSFCSPGHPHWHTSTLRFLHHTLHFLSSHTSFCVSYPLLLWFLLCWLFLADRLQLDVMAETEAGSWVCRLAFRAPLYGQSPRNTPTHLSHTCRRHSTQRRASAFLQVTWYLFLYSKVKKHFLKKGLLKSIMQFHKKTNLRYL